MGTEYYRNIFLFWATVHHVCVGTEVPNDIYEVRIIVSHSNGLSFIGNPFGSRYSSPCLVSIAVTRMNGHTCSFMSI